MFNVCSNDVYVVSMVTGKAATAALLEGSKKVYPFAGKFYEKYGGYDEAVKDFYSVNPINVRSFRSQSGVGKC